tara:strand:+ start:23397 stop:24212 length:816 start_codon:yes stop_codon:yes gene_type:complete
MKKLKILVACEESQAVTIELRKLGHEAYSCDLLPCSGGHPEWHFQSDLIDVMNGWFDQFEVCVNPNFALNFDVYSGNEEFEYTKDSIKQIGWNWDLMIAFPPCTFLAVSGARWMYHPEDKDLDFKDRRPHPKHPNRRQEQKDALQFVQNLMNAPINQVAIENPIGVISTHIRKPDQVVQPWMFGDKATKSTCLWLKNLPKLEPTNIVDKGEFFEFISKKGEKKRMPMWYYQALQKAKTPEERRTLRSKTFKGIAEAMANQWTQDYIKDTLF